MAIGTATAIGAGISALSGIANAAANMSASERAASLQNKALQEWLKINIPDPKEQEIALQKYVDQGEIDPQLEKAIRQDPSEFTKITTSPQYKASQVRALKELEDLGYSGGLRLQDEAALQESMLQTNVQDRANRDAIAAEMARRGVSGSGFEVASRLQNQQASTDRNAANSLKIAAQAQDRALQSILGAGDLASKYRGQDFSEQAQRASAADAINRFNTSNLQDVQQRNISSQNRAAEMNLADKQRIADQNVGLSNQQQLYNKGLAQQNYDNQLRRAAGATGQFNTIANAQGQQGQALGNVFTNIGKTAAEVGAVSDKNAAAAEAKADSDAKYAALLAEMKKSKQGQAYP